MTEETMLDEALQLHRISDEHQQAIRAYLEILGRRDENTMRHSIRVGISNARITEYVGLDAKAGPWAGLLHDIGKALVDTGLLNKKERFTEEDYKHMEPHVINGWNMLQGIFDWTAQIIVRHHRYGKRPYPALLPSPSPDYAEGTDAKFERYARLLALADYYDALMYRNNDKHGTSPLSLAEKRELYLRENGDQRELILELENAGILTFSA